MPLKIMFTYHIAVHVVSAGNPYVVSVPTNAPCLALANHGSYVPHNTLQVPYLYKNIWVVIYAH